MILISSTFAVSNLIVHANNMFWLPLFTVYKKSWAKEITFVVSGHLNHHVAICLRKGVTDLEERYFQKIVET